ncbi:MAG: hypothetical protein AAGF59_13825 [Pseudomonadota bacterium]
MTIAPLIVYNLVVFGFLGDTAGQGDPWFQPIFTVEMVSGARWTLFLGDLLVIAGMVLLFFEILKATRTGPGSIVDHLLSTFVFTIYLVEFLVVPQAAHSIFFTLMVIALIDVVGGFSIAIRGARRDFAVGPGD